MNRWCAVLAASCLVTSALAADYAEPNLADWYRSLMQPDQPQVSCCGAADAYYADETDFDEQGNLIAIITDTRPDRRTLADGKVINRPHIAVGTRIFVPPHKIRKPPQPNPTDHTIIFVSTQGWVYCYEPVPLI